MTLPDKWQNLNRAFSRLTAYKEFFTLGEYYILPQILHVSPLIGAEVCTVHSHRSYEYSIMLAGKMCYDVNHTRSVVKEGDGLIIPANIPHHWELIEPSIVLGFMFYINCNGDGARRRMALLNQAIQRNSFHFPDFEEGFEEAQHLLQTFATGRGFLNERIRYFTRKLALSMFEQLLPQGDSKANSSRANLHLRGNSAQEILENLEFYINDNIYSRLEVSDLAAYAGMSVNHLNGILKRSKGVTANEWIWQRRIYFATQLLDTTNHQVKEIAASVGIEDVGYFCRRFKAIAGVSPAAYRLRKRTGERV